MYVVVEWVSGWKSKRVYSLSTLPLKISIDIIMKSICETNASPKKKIKYAPRKKSVKFGKEYTQKNGKKRRRSEYAEDECVWEKTALFNLVHLIVFPKYIYCWCSVDARTRNCSLKTSYIMVDIPNQNLHMLNAWFFYFLFTCFHSLICAHFI